MTAYFDASAAVKLFRGEVESEALRTEMVRWHPHVASEILAVELRCVARRSEDAEEARRAEDVLSAIALIPWRAVTAQKAGTLTFDPALRALDAIHLATALSLRDDLTVLVAYDRELLAAARAEGLGVVSPGVP